MTLYKDTNGLDRVTKITVGAVERCKECLDLDLYNLEAVGLYTQDTMQALRLIWVIQTDPGKSGESFDEWFENHQGDAVDEAAKSFLKAYENFSPSRLSAMIRGVNQAVSREIDSKMTILENSLGEFLDFSKSTPEG